MTDWCFSGPIGNWLYGLDRAVWATNNQHNHVKWFAEMQHGDNVMIYITRGIGMVGHCIVSDKAGKNEPWWPDEIKASTNLYPNVVYLNQIYLVADIKESSNLRKLAIAPNECRTLGLTQRNITGGVNVVRGAGVFERLRDELLLRSGGTLSRAYPLDESPEHLGRVRERIAEYLATKGASSVQDTTDLDTSDIDPDATPDRVETVVQLWRRNRWIVENRKLEMNNRCEIPGCEYTPFWKASGELYSEGHHLIPLGRLGSANPHNIIVLCPNHHREIHYGARKEELEASLKAERGL